MGRHRSEDQGRGLTTPMVRRDAALGAMRDHDISQRWACARVGVDPKTVRRERPRDTPEIRKEMGEIAETRRRFGYCRFRILAVSDDCCRGNLGLIADASIPGDRVTRELDAPVRLCGKPEMRWRQRHRVHRKDRPEMGQGQWH